jgi:hypothetical protein
MFLHYFSLPNFLDLDSDGDGIGDKYELTADPDADGLPNYLGKNHYAC